MPAERFEEENRFSGARPDFDLNALFADQEGADDAVWELLNLYIDGEATPEQSAQVESLRRSDPAVARELEFLRQAGAGARSYIELEPPAHLRQAIFAATIHRPTLTRRVAAGWSALRAEWRRYALPAGALAAAGLAAFALWPRPGPPVAPERMARLDPTPAPIIAPKQEPENPAIEPPSAMVKPDSHPEKSAKPAPEPTPEMRLADRKAVEERESIRMARAVPQDAKLRTDLIVTAGGQEREGRARPAVLRESPKAAQARLPKPPRLKMITPKVTPESDPWRIRAASAESRFSYQPGMDARNMRLAWALEKRSPEQEDTPDVTVADPKSGGSEPEETTPPSGSGLTRRQGRILRDRLPPDPRLMWTGADLKREREALTQGYDKNIRDSMQRHQATVSLVGRF